MKWNLGNGCTNIKLALYFGKFAFSFSCYSEKIIREFEEEQ